MSSRREELTRIAARLFAERGYPGTSLADLADALGMQKPSLYHHIASKEDLLWEVAWEGAEAFHSGLDSVPADAPATERIRLALRAHLAVVAGQLDIATVFVREWRYLEGERRDRFVAERHRYEERIRALYREGVEGSELRTDLDVATAALLFLSAANWATPGSARLEHRPARRPALRHAARRHARLRDSGLSERELARAAHLPPGSSSSIRTISCALAAIGNATSRSSGVSLTVRCGITSSKAPFVRRAFGPALPDRGSQSAKRRGSGRSQTWPSSNRSTRSRVKSKAANCSRKLRSAPSSTASGDTKGKRIVTWAGTPRAADQSCSSPDRAHGRLGLRHRNDQGGAAWHARKREARPPDRQPYSTHVTGARITEVENALRERIDLRTEFTQRPGHATELAADGAASDVDAILVFSGDGTYNEALNGADGEVPFGFLPGGGTSVLPRALGVPRDPVDAARAAGAAIAASRLRRISLGR